MDSVIAIIISIVVTVIGGVILLSIEYKSGWFAERAGVPSLKSGLEILKRKIDTYLCIVKNASVQIFRFLWYAAVLFASVYLLTGEALDNPAYRFELYTILVFAGLFALERFDKPMNRINATMVFAILFTAYNTIGPVDNNSGKLIWLSDEDFRSFQDGVRTTESTIYSIALFILAGVWIAFHFLNGFYAKSNDARDKTVNRKIELLYESPGIQRILLDSDSSRLKKFLGRYDEFLAYVRNSNEANSDMLGHSVPVRFDGYNLHIGCTTSTDRNNLERVWGEGTQTYPPRIDEIMANLQEFLGNPNYQIIVQLITTEQFEQKKREIQRLSSE